MSTTEKPTEATEETATNEIPQLGALEEDDEFEEFPVQDWDDSEADLSHLVSGASSGNAAAQATSETFWEENWDDDDIEDDFSKQLREELSKTGSNAPDAQMTS